MKAHKIHTVLLSASLEKFYINYKEDKVNEYMRIVKESGDCANEMELWEKAIEIESFVSTFDILMEKQKYFNSYERIAKLNRKEEVFIEDLCNIIVESLN
jgi:hypothetical protein